MEERRVCVCGIRTYKRCGSVLFFRRLYFCIGAVGEGKVLYCVVLYCSALICPICDT